MFSQHGRGVSSFREAGQADGEKGVTSAVTPGGRHCLPCSPLPLLENVWTFPEHLLFPPLQNGAAPEDTNLQGTFLQEARNNILYLVFMRIMCRIVLIISTLWAAVLLCCHEAAGQTLLQGRIVDAVTGEELYSANVQLPYFRPQGRVTGTTSDGGGHFSLRLPVLDSATLRCSYVGYKTLDTTLLLQGKGVLHLTLRLQPDVILQPGVEVVDYRRDRTTFHNLEKIETQHMTGASEGVEALLKTLPDVSSNNEMSSQFSVRGGSFDENLVYINNVEVFRPMLIRSAQQEGMSIINSDLVRNINFSPGGFDATYGDKMSSVLDIAYQHGKPGNYFLHGDTLRQRSFGGSLSASLLGANANVHGTLMGDRLDYNIGFRQHNNRYVFGTLDTKGDYTTHYTDFQGLVGCQLTPKLRAELLTILSRNIYGLIPESQTTTFGHFMESMELDVYFDGQELDRYRTALTAVTFSYKPGDLWHWSWTTSAQRNVESEVYDIQSQYWLYELHAGVVDTGDQRVNRGVGSYLEHARNSLTTNVWNTELRGTRYASLGDWRFGLRLQREMIDDRVREWKWVDSAGYTLPFIPDVPGDSTNQPQAPLLQKYCVAHNQVAHNRALAFLYRDVALLTDAHDRITLAAGVRGQLYTLSADTAKHVGDYQSVSAHLLLSPRLSAGYRPHQLENLLVRAALGIYSQAPFYREYRRDDGTLNLRLTPQHSYQAMLTAVYDFQIWQRPFQLTTDVYYKYITDLITYRVDNLRLRYDANNDAVGYATGLSMRINGEFVPGVQSWASFSWMKTQEDISGDTLGWLNRPTDQRLSFKLFFQDYVPRLPFWQMSLSFITGGGLPVMSPFGNRASQFRLPAYFRVDWGNTIQLSRLEKLHNAKLFRNVKDIWLTLDVFNLFGRDNVISYIWVSDYTNTYYPVPNNLTGRQVNVKLTVQF